MEQADSPGVLIERELAWESQQTQNTNIYTYIYQIICIINLNQAKTNTPSGECCTPGDKTEMATLYDSDHLQDGVIVGTNIIKRFDLEQWNSSVLSA